VNNIGAGGVAQVVECLTSKGETLCSNPVLKTNMEETAYPKTLETERERERENETGV
jgi:hypothetical protein